MTSDDAATAQANDKIILLPAFAALKEEVEKLRTELSMLVLERDELRYVECKNIETAYLLALGGLEYKAFEAECRLLRLRRKVELVQAKRNRQEKIILPEIDAALDREFAEYLAKLEEQIKKINWAIERDRLDILTEEEYRELKKGYRQIVKALHPDLHPEQGEAQLRLFINATLAYENGDVNTIRLICDMVASNEPAQPCGDALADMMKEKERLAGPLQGIRTSIEKIKAEYPYTLRELVASPELLKARRAEVENTIRQYEEASAACQQRLETLVMNDG